MVLANAISPQNQAPQPNQVLETSQLQYLLPGSSLVAEFFLVEQESLSEGYISIFWEPRVSPWVASLSLPRQRQKTKQKNIN